MAQSIKPLADLGIGFYGNLHVIEIFQNKTLENWGRRI